ncbi:MAG: uroporphyrinogen-III synthase [Dermatophilaceae bacterium]|jgi:uroporphyrinogen III methyltransferase/synthase|nr:uroporphyrinogen-III synthase [Actinomycetales bacterium]MBP9917299.1 uroporphyrinogen-III synthase [Dermatophilaceae bacterium]
MTTSIVTTDCADVLLPDAVAAARVVFVGAGPGDPGLMTVRSREVLSVADVVVVDDPAQADFVAGFTQPAARIIPTRAADHSGQLDQMSRGDCATVMISAARELGSEGTVVRLVDGDPGLCHDFADEALALRSAGVVFDVVPGISAVTAAPTYAGVPLTSSSATTVHVVHAGMDEHDWSASVSDDVTVVIHGEPLAQAEALGGLLRAGRLGSTLIAIVESGTTTAQATHVMTLADGVRRVGALVARVNGDPPIIVVGPTVALRESLSWFESKPLYGWRVLVPRTREPSGATTRRLTAYGARPTLVPTISVEPPRSPQHMDRAIHGLVTGRYSWLGFTSVNAVRAVCDKVDELGLDARIFAGVHVAAVGGVTAEALRQWGIIPDLIPSGEQSAAGMLADWPDPDDDESAVNRVFLPRADIATETLVAGLTEAGWEVDDVTAYRTVRAAPPPPEIREAIKGGAFDAVLFTSSSTVRNLVGIAGKPHAQTLIACIGPQTAKTAQEHGLRVDVLAPAASPDALVDALAAHGAGLAAAARDSGVPVRRPSQRRHGSRRRAR